MGDLFRYFLERDGIKSCIAESKKKRDPNCWISPEGIWYNVGVCNHNAFAYQAIKEMRNLTLEQTLNYKGYRSLFECANEELLKEGWIYTESTFYTGTILRGYQHMNEKQYKVLLETFGDTPLFRGWTIRAMWLAKEDMKQEAKSD